MKEVGIRLKVGATGLENLNELGRQLKEAGVDTSALDAQAEALGQTLQALGAKQQAIDTFKQIRVETDAAAKALDGAAAEVERLGAELPQATAATNALAQAERQAAGAIDATRADLDEMGQALDRLNAEYTGAARQSETYRVEQAQLQATIAELKTTLRDQQAALKAAASATTEAGRNEQALAAEYERAVSSARKLSGELGTKRSALEASRSSVKALGLETSNLAQTERNLATAVDAAKQQVAELAPAYERAAAASRSAGQQQLRDQATVRDSVAQLGTQLGKLQGAISLALGGGLAGGLIKDLANTADEVRNLQSRLQLATGGVGDFASTFGSVANVALSTNSALEETGTLFSRLVQAGRDAGLSSLQAQQQSLALTTTINQAIQLSGGSAEASSAAITQLVQGLQGGVLRGDEFNSVMEQAPRLARALADGLGVTTGELRKMAEQGQLTSQTVISALQGQSDALQNEFSQLPATVGRALQNLTTRWQLYVAQADQATGASAAAASVIQGLADNLDLLGGTLWAVGKAAAAYQALKLAGVFVEQAAAARAAAAAKTQEAAATTAGTAAMVANTAATTANTAAKAANAAAAGATAVAWGTMAQGLKIGGLEAAATATNVGLIGRAAQGAAGLITGTLRLALATITAPASLIMLLVNFREIGTAIGEGAAKLMGWGKVVEENEAKMAEAAKAAELLAKQQADQARAAQEAADKALGLSKAAKALVADFDQARANGDSLADALGKVAKALQLDDVTGIQDAGAALDALAVKGKVSAAAVRDAWAQALDGKDLGIFETQARAAFDGSEQGARRLKAAIDAIAEESLRRAGTSTTELLSGFSAAANSAINDVDQLVATLERLKIGGDQAGRLLASSLNRALEASQTERAVQAVIERIQQLGNAGKLTGDQLTQALAAARAKADELQAGINSLDEAMAKFGLQSRQQLQDTATTMGEAWQRIANSTEVSLADQRRAFEQWSAAAIAANNGIEPSAVSVARRMLEIREAAAAAATGVETSMSRAGTSIDGVSSKAARAVAALNQIASGINTLSSAQSQLNTMASNSSGATYNSDGWATNTSGQVINAAGKQYTPPDSSGNWTFVNDARAGMGQYSIEGVGYWVKNGSTSVSTVPSSWGPKVKGSSAGTSASGTSVINTSDPSTWTPAAAASASASSTSHTVTLNFAGASSRSVQMASAADATALVSALEEAARRAGAA